MGSIARHGRSERPGTPGPFSCPAFGAAAGDRRSPFSGPKPWAVARRPGPSGVGSGSVRLMLHRRIARGIGKSKFPMLGEVRTDPVGREPYRGEELHGAGARFHRIAKRRT